MCENTILCGPAKISSVPKKHTHNMLSGIFSLPSSTAGIYRVVAESPNYATKHRRASCCDHFIKNRQTRVITANAAWLTHNVSPVNFGREEIDSDEHTNRTGLFDSRCAVPRASARSYTFRRLMCIHIGYAAFWLALDEVMSHMWCLYMYVCVFLRRV